MGELIDRQAAIDAINEIIRMEHSLRPKVYVAKDAIKALPSAQPEISMEQIKIWLDAWEGYVDKDIIARMKYRVIDIPLVQTREETT